MINASLESTSTSTFRTRSGKTPSRNSSRLTSTTSSSLEDDVGEISSDDERRQQTAGSTRQSPASSEVSRVRTNNEVCLL
jgi:hypothetical protein